MCIRDRSNVDEVDFAILLKKDRIILLVMKFIIMTIIVIDSIIIPVDIRADTDELIP